MPDISAALEAIKEAVGPKGYFADALTMAPYLVDWRQRYFGEAPLVVLPKCTAEVAAVVRICASAGIPIVPQGGNTGLVGGSVPGPNSGAIVVNLSRMNRIMPVDADGFVMEVEAGAVLAKVQEAAEAADRLFPLSLAAEGSCQIGGNIATDAGGIHVLRFGTTRSLVLGLEAVLPSGQVWNGLSPVLKDTAGYDLKHLFIGSEGTLGIITRASLRLFPRYRAKTSLLFALEGLEEAMTFFAFAREAYGGNLVAYEVFPEFGMELVLEHVPGNQRPFAGPYPWYALVELWEFQDPDHQALVDRATGIAEKALGKGLVLDAVAAASSRQEAALWRIRESMAEAERAEGAGIKHDVSVPIAKLAELVSGANAEVEKLLPGIRVHAFGHAGDGNLHYNFAPPIGMDDETFLEFREPVMRIVHDRVVALGGSIAAEHGIGRSKRDELKRCLGEAEIVLLQAVKAALDPQGIMNPGVLV